MRKVFLCMLYALCLQAQEVQSDQQYRFLGKHFIASYAACDVKALQNVEGLKSAMRQGVKETGAQVLNESSHIFEGNGLTMVFLLSESHASIHTYPEHNACFVDLFTCGDHCHYTAFDQVLRGYLKPETVSSKVLIRDEAIQEQMH